MGLGQRQDYGYAYFLIAVGITIGVIITITAKIAVGIIVGVIITVTATVTDCG